MARTRIVVFGDSHVQSIKDAARAKSADAAFASVEILRRLKMKGGGAASPDSTDNDGVAPARRVGDTSFDDVKLKAATLKPHEALVSAVGGSVFSVFSTVQHPQPFDFVIPDDSSSTIEPDAEMIPFRTIYDQVARSVYKSDGSALVELREATKARMIHVLPPPPKYDNAFISKNFDTRFAAEGIERLGVSEPQLRMKFWRVQNLALTALCDALGIEILPPPESALTASGFLAAPYWAPDATHANAHYGALVMKQIGSHLRTNREAGRQRAKGHHSLTGTPLAGFLADFYSVKQAHSRKRRQAMDTAKGANQGATHTKQQKILKDLLAKPGALDTYDIKIAGKAGDPKIKITLEQKPTAA